MSLFTRFVRDAGAHLAASGLASRLLRENGDAKAQKQVLERLLERFAQTDYGRVHRLEARLGHDDFVKRVPVMTQEALAPYLVRLEHGGENLLWPQPCESLLGELAAPGETQRRYPLTAASRQAFLHAWRSALFAGSLHKIPAIHFGRPALAIGLTPGSLAPHETAPTDLRSLVARCALSHQELASLPLPGPGDTQSPQGPDAELLLLEDPLWLATLFPDPLIGTDSGTMLAQRPGWTRELRVAVGYRQTMQGMSDQARLLLGHPVRVHEVFATEFGVVATQTEDPNNGLRLLTDEGLYYEFIPVADYDPAHQDRLSAKALPSDKVVQGASYVLVVSSPAGLCRQDTDERVRCVSTHPLRIVPEGRQSRTLSVAGEQLTERDAFDAVAHCCDQHGWAIVHLHVAPLPKSAERRIPAHEWWIELKPGSRQTPTGPHISTMLDEQLRRQSPAYDALRRNAVLAEPVVRLVIPGVFKNWLQANGLLDTRFSLPRCLRDRRIADALAALARFSD
jgi:hypothetical protein